MPSVETKFGVMDQLHPELRHMVKIFTDSAENQLFSVQYTLQVFVKHQSKLEFGMGNFAEFPIKIQSKKQNLPVAATREEMWHAGQEISEWLP